MADSDDKAYRVEREEDSFRVLDESDRVVMVCRDEGSANEYAVLLNSAYRKGFKVGFREGRSAR
jgi:hypothetical protein